MSSSAQRKRRTTGSPLVSRPSTKTSRAAYASRAANTRRTANTTRVASATRVANRTANLSRASDVDPAPTTETIDVMDNTEDSVEEVVDLTCEGSEAAAVVDLTNNDSVLLVDEGPQNRRAATGESYVVSSDEDEVTPPTLNAAMLSSIQANSAARWTPGTISCPVCMDSYSESRAADWWFPLNVVMCSAASV
ncbi:RING finger protein 4 isoform X3 [Thunnus albacares]|uniref:RING finger protein 4 isoform X2 n=1 Tax=Thunnus maccoyii TaxID=8240 RepID=UPI001C4C42ED|nr:RING finger protein 4 isoform X2 [Thunnus maccoyii]XP_044220069.1 RING finger protein 4 isoform X3 [Thunnus albacares]